MAFAQTQGKVSFRAGTPAPNRSVRSVTATIDALTTADRNNAVSYSSTATSIDLSIAVGLLGEGFQCELINVSAGNVRMIATASGIMRALGASEYLLGQFSLNLGIGATQIFMDGVGAPGSTKAWAEFSSSTTPTLAGFNASVRRINTGIYTVDFAVNMPATSYGFDVSVAQTVAAKYFYGLLSTGTSGQMASSFDVGIFNSGGAAADAPRVSVKFY